MSLFLYFFSRNTYYKTQPTIDKFKINSIHIIDLKGKEKL